MRYLHIGLQNFIFATVILCVLVGTLSCSNKNLGAISNGCKDVPQLRWQSEIVKTDRAPKQLFKLLAAAKKDSAQISRALASINGNISLESNFSNELRKVVEQKSEVSQEFWEQNLHYQQTLCFLESQASKVKNPELQKQYNDLILELVKLRMNYTYGYEQLKKKIKSTE